MEMKERLAEIFTVIHPDGRMATCVRKCRALYDDSGQWKEDIGGFEVVDATADDVSEIIGPKGAMAARLSGVQIENTRLIKQVEELSNQLAKLEKQVAKAAGKRSK